MNEEGEEEEEEKRGVRCKEHGDWKESLQKNKKNKTIKKYFKVSF